MKDLSTCKELWGYFFLITAGREDYSLTLPSCWCTSTASKYSRVSAHLEGSKKRSSKSVLDIILKGTFLQTLWLADGAGVGCDIQLWAGGGGTK
jgi:hypothetical protein